jgi:hypothetical protein
MQCQRGDTTGAIGCRNRTTPRVITAGLTHLSRRLIPAPLTLILLPLSPDHCHSNIIKLSHATSPSLAHKVGWCARAVASAAQITQ